MIATLCRRARFNEPIEVTALDGAHSQFDSGECFVQDLGSSARIFESARPDRPRAEISGDTLSELLVHHKLVFLSCH